MAPDRNSPPASPDRPIRFGRPLRRTPCRPSPRPASPTGPAGPTGSAGSIGSTGSIGRIGRIGRLGPMGPIGSTGPIKPNPPISALEPGGRLRRLALACLLAALTTLAAAPAAPAADSADAAPDANAAGAETVAEPPTLYLCIIDDSSSMHQNDPTDLRLQAAQLTLALAQPGDQWAVVRFRKAAKVFLKPTSVGSVADRFKDVPAALGPPDEHTIPDGTNFVAAFARAQETLDAWSGHGRVMVIFLTDGEDVDVTNEALSFSVHTLAKKAYARGAYDFQMKIIGLGKEISTAQLNLIREESKGTLIEVANAADLIDRVLSVIVQSQNIGRLDPPLPNSFEVGPDVLRIGIIGVGGKGRPGAGHIGFLSKVSIQTPAGKKIELLDDPNCRLFPATQDFIRPERYQIAIADHPPAGRYTLQTAGDFQLVDIVIERRLQFVVNPAEPPGRAAQYEPIDLSVYMVGGGKNLETLGEHTRVTADVFGPFAPNLDPSGRIFNESTRVGAPIELTRRPGAADGRVEFTGRIDGLALGPDALRDGAFTIRFRTVTRENSALVWTRSLPPRDVFIERQPGRLHLTLTDPADPFESVDRLTKNLSLRVLNTFLAPLPVLVDFRLAHPDQPQPAGLQLPPPQALILPPGREVNLSALPLSVDEE
ncbi:MAG: VWA domain-containing protein, partial [Planctomycetota bacterium]